MGGTDPWSARPVLFTDTDTDTDTDTGAAAAMPAVVDVPMPFDGRGHREVPGG